MNNIIIMTTTVGRKKNNNKNNNNKTKNNNDTNKDNFTNPIHAGVSYIFKQSFFQQLCQQTGIDLENIVYYKDETHYFVMTAKKHSLLLKKVLLKVRRGEGGGDD